jgi:alpha-amylase
MVAWRNTAGTSGMSNWQDGSNNDQIAFSRGNVAFIAMNRGSSTWTNFTFKTGLKPGNYCNIIVSDDVTSCPVVVVNSNGEINTNVPSLSAVAIHTNKMKK